LQYLFGEVVDFSQPTVQVDFLGRLSGKTAQSKTVTAPVDTTAFLSDGYDEFIGALTDIGFEIE